MAFDPSYIVTDTTIANGGTTSAAIDVPDGLSPVGFITPSALTSTAATFTVSVDGTNFYALKKNDGSASISYTVAASGYYPMNPADWCGIANFKIVVGSAEAAARTITLVFRPI